MIVLGMVGGWLCRSYHFRDEVKMMQNDTIVRTDTIREYYPVEVSREVIDTMLVIVRDTIREKEVLYMPLLLDKKVYASDEYYAEVSGYKPNLDYIEVFPKTKVITKTIQPVTNRNALSVGVEVGYMNALSLPIYLEYERMLHKNVRIYGRLFYDLPANSYGLSAGAKFQTEF